MNNHLLIIMRHAKTEPVGSVPTDFERELTGRGRRDAKKMGAWLGQEKLLPGAIITSPAARTVHTARIVSKALDLKTKQIIEDREIYEAALSDLLPVIARHAAGHRCLLLIGHNPGMEELLQYLSADHPEPNKEGKVLTTAAVAVLDYGHGAITTGKGSARLLCLTRPRD